MRQPISQHRQNQISAAAETECDQPRPAYRNDGCPRRRSDLGSHQHVLSAITASISGPGTLTNPSVAAASVRLCATVTRSLSMTVPVANENYKRERTAGDRSRTGCVRRPGADSWPASPAPVASTKKTSWWRQPPRSARPVSVSMRANTSVTSPKSLNVMTSPASPPSRRMVRRSTRLRC